MAFVNEENITDLAAARWATARPERLSVLMESLVRHLHDFAREVELSEDEWMAGIQWLVAAGQISDEKRQELILASDVLGLSMLVVQLNNRFGPEATPATVLGPFHIDGSPPAAFGADMSDGLPGTPLFITGRVTDTDGQPVPGALLDVWQADSDGLYEAQIAEIDEARLRAKYQAGDDGSYCVRTIAPLGYTIPMDGPVGHLMRRTSISEYRPAHVHFLLEVPGYRRLITHLFEEGTPYLDSDVVFGVKDALIVRFEQHEGRAPTDEELDRPFLVAHYDFVLQADET